MRLLTTVLATTAILAGGAGALPAQAAPEAAGARTTVKASDPARDAITGTPAGREAADIRAVEIVTPSEPGGIMTFRVKFAKLHNGFKEGAPGQHVAVGISKRGGPDVRFWDLRASNRAAGVTLTDDTSKPRIRPEVVEVERTFKRGGIMTIKVSTEWLDATRFDVDVDSRSGRAIDKGPDFTFNLGR